MPKLNTHPSSRRDARHAERGVVLIYAMIGLLLVTGIVVAGSMRDYSAAQTEAVDFAVEGHARQIAESGIVDGIAWLRSHPSQPVRAFAPQRDLAANPPIDETDDASLGLVREFEISAGIWGRYVVRRPQPAEPFVDANKNGYFDPQETFEDLDGDGQRTMALGAADVSALRGAPKAGTVWYLESEGSVYRKADADAPLGEGRNHRLGRVVISSEVRRLSVVIPASAAIVVPDGDKATIEGAYVGSPVLGVAYRPGGRPLEVSTDPKDSLRVVFDAPMAHAGVPGWVTSGVGAPDPQRIRVEDVFGVDMETLRAMADYNISGLGELPGLVDGASDPIIEEVAGVLKRRMPYSFPEDAFVVITPPSGEVVFDDVHPLVGTGVVVVNGDLRVEPKSNTDFSGVLFVTGTMTVERSGVFRGITIAGERLIVHGRMATTGVVAAPSTRAPSSKSKKTRKTIKTTKTAKPKTTKTAKPKTTKTVKAKTTKTSKTKKTTKTVKAKTTKAAAEVKALPAPREAPVAKAKTYKARKTLKSGKTRKSRCSSKSPGKYASVKAKTSKTKKTTKTAKKKTSKTAKTKTVKPKTQKKIKTRKVLKSLRSTPEESVWFGHDPDLVDRLIRELGRYRRWKASYRPVPVHEDGRPDERFRTNEGLRMRAAKAVTQARTPAPAGVK